jgi:hypothetical protein
VQYRKTESCLEDTNMPTSAKVTTVQTAPTIATEVISHRRYGIDIDDSVLEPGEQLTWALGCCMTMGMHAGLTSVFRRFTARRFASRAGEKHSVPIRRTTSAPLASP